LPSRINKRLFKEGIIGGFDLGKIDRQLKNHWLLCVTEKRTRGEMDRLVDTLRRMVS
jgi:glycine dehydrogenase subunit 1